jgi:hypothetical protein
MSPSMFFGNASTVNDWRGMLELLKKANAEYTAALPIMTPFERQGIGQSIKEKREQYRKSIEAGVIEQHTEAINNYKAKLSRVEAERRKIINSWDAAKLAPELQVYRLRVDTAAQQGSREALEAIYQEAKDSGDKYKLRAAVEALQNVNAKIPLTAMDIHGELVRQAGNHLETQAKNDLAALRTSADLEAAYKDTAAAVEAIKAAEKEIYRTAEVFQELAPNGAVFFNTTLEKAKDRVHFMADGSIGIKEDSNEQEI